MYDDRIAHIEANRVYANKGSVSNESAISRKTQDQEHNHASRI